MFAHARKDKRLEAAVTQALQEANAHATPLLTEAFWREIRRAFIVPKITFYGQSTASFVSAIQRLLVDYGIPTSSQYHSGNYDTVIEFESDEPAIYMEAEDKGRIMLGLLLDLRMTPSVPHMFPSLYRVFITLPYEVSRILIPEWRDRPETMSQFSIFHHIGAEANWDTLRAAKQRGAVPATGLTNETAVLLAYIFFRFVTRNADVQDGHMLSLWEHFMNWVTNRATPIDAVYQLPIHYPQLLHDLARSAFRFRGFLRTYHASHYDDDNDRSRSVAEYFLNQNVNPLEGTLLNHTTRELLEFNPGFIRGIHESSKAQWKEDVTVLPQDLVAAHKMLIDSLNFRDAVHLVQFHEKLGADNATILLLHDVSALDVSRTITTVWAPDADEKVHLPTFAVFPFFSALRRQEDTLLVMNKNSLAQTTLLGALQCCWSGKAPRSRLADTEVQWHMLFKEIVLVMRALEPQEQEAFWTRITQIAFGHAMISWSTLLPLLRQMPRPHFTEVAFFVAQVCMGEVTIEAGLWKKYHSAILRHKWPFPLLSQMEPGANHLGLPQTRELAELITSPKYITQAAKVKFCMNVHAVADLTTTPPPASIGSLQGDPSAKKLPYHGQPAEDDTLLLEFFAVLEYYTRQAGMPKPDAIKETWFRQLHVLGIDCQWRKLTHVFPVLYGDRRPLAISDSLLYSMLKHTERVDLIKCASDTSAEGLLGPELNREVGALSSEIKKLCGIPVDMQLDRLSDTNTNLFSPPASNKKPPPQFKGAGKRTYGSADLLF